jgi:hypothetical protein
MPAKDFLHNAVRTALEKDGWTITHDPLTIELTRFNLYIDLAAERIIAAEREGQYIAVEIKSFVGESFLSQFHLALGQILNYRTALRSVSPQRTLYLALPDSVYNEFFTDPFIQNQLHEYNIKLIVIDALHEEIATWTK